MKLSLTHSTNKVNPSEMRYLRGAVDTTATGCKDAAIQAVVSYAQLALGLDLRQEAKALKAEYALVGSRPALRLA